MLESSIREKIERVVSRETTARLEIFADIALRWNETHNLFAKSTVARFWDRHVLDSLQLLPLARDRRYFLDLGSGGGFPGIILAIALEDSKDSFVHLVESNAKKSAFLAGVIGKLGLRAQVYADRIENLSPSRLSAEIVTARGFAPLSLTLRLACPWLVDGAVGLFQKGRGFEKELAEAAHHWSFQVIKHPSAIEHDSVVLEISDLKSMR